MGSLRLAFGLALLAILLSGCGSSLGGDNTATCGVDSCGICPNEQSGVRICKVVDFPSNEDSVTLINYDNSLVNLANWTLWNQATLDAGTGEHVFTGSDVLNPKSTQTFTSLGFTIDGSGDRIYLKNSTGSLVDTDSLEK